MIESTVHEITSVTRRGVKVESEPESPPPPAQPAADALVEAELLVEDVSIDGMCGVY